jgi:hypothetical protein
VDVLLILMIVLPIGKPTKPKIFHRHQRMTTEAMMPTEQNMTVWRLEIMSLMLVVDVPLVVNRGSGFRVLTFLDSSSRETDVSLSIE